MAIGKKEIEEALKGVLPGVKSHLKMIPPGRSIRIPVANAANVKQSGVLVLLFPNGKEISTCLIRRPSYMKDHAGQIGFPGGKSEQNDANPLQTAIRESMEEIGISAKDFIILGALSTIYISVSGFLIFPYVAWSDTIPDFHPNHEEVEKLLVYPLLHLTEERRVTFVDTDTQSGKLNVPAFLFGEEIIWGATAMILAEFADILERAVKEQPTP